MVGVKGGDKNNKALGQIVQVQGGHVIRATGLKDRHSKVFTAKGPRDRRVRLSAQTAIQFYDVQDRLGYDRPSKAVDWLINKAKDSIDKLPALPPWDPSSVVNATSSEHSQIHEDVHTGTLSPYGVNFQNYPPPDQQQQQQQHLSLSLQGPGDETTNPPVFHESGGLFDGGFARLMGWSSQYQTPQVAYNFQRGTLQSSNLFSHPNFVPISGFGFGSEGGYPSHIQEDHQRQQLRGGSGSMSNTNGSSSSLSPGSSSQH